MNAGQREAARSHLAPVMAEVERWRAEGATWRECCEIAAGSGFRSRLGLPFTERGLRRAYTRFQAGGQAETKV